MTWPSSPIHVSLPALKHSARHSFSKGKSTVNELLRLTLLQPALIQAILSGKQPRCMSLLRFQRNPLPTDWAAQREVVARFDA